MPKTLNGRLSPEFYNDVEKISKEMGIEMSTKKFNEMMGTSFEPESLGVGLPQRNFVTFTDAPKKAGTIVKSHEYAHYAHTPLEKAPGINYGYLEELYGDAGQRYFDNLNGTEVAARFTQLKNYFGLKEGEEITPEMWQYAKEHYIKDTHVDNSMTEFFNMVYPDKLTDFLKWGNRNAPAVLGTVAAETAAEERLKSYINKDKIDDGDEVWLPTTVLLKHQKHEKQERFWERNNAPSARVCACFCDRQDVGSGEVAMSVTFRIPYDTQGIRKQRTWRHNKGL